MKEVFSTFFIDLVSRMWTLMIMKHDSKIQNSIKESGGYTFRVCCMQVPS